MLVLRTLWVERNARVFEENTTTIRVVLGRAMEEWNLWLSCRRGFLRGVR
jgi:hypothetical protein